MNDGITPQAGTANSASENSSVGRAEENGFRTLSKRSDNKVPARVLVISIIALAIPLAAAFTDPINEQYDVLFWLFALIPAFFLAYYRGWRGAATAMVAGMGVLTFAQVGLEILGRTSQTTGPLFLVVLVAFIGITLGIGYVTELLHVARSQSEQLAFVDPLTGISNRRSADLFLEKEFAAAQRGRKLTLVMFDIDHFKQFNDKFGHRVGDDALRMFAHVLIGNTRRMNLSARYGGEEFVTILSETDVVGGVSFAERVRKSLMARSVAGENLTVCAGVVQYSPTMTDVQDLVSAADSALYQAKSDGRDCVRVNNLRHIPPTTPLKPVEAESDGV